MAAGYAVADFQALSPPGEPSRPLADSRRNVLRRVDNEASDQPSPRRPCLRFREQEVQGHRASDLRLVQADRLLGLAAMFGLEEKRVPTRIGRVGRLELREGLRIVRRCALHCCHLSP